MSACKASQADGNFPFPQSRQIAGSGLAAGASVQQQVIARIKTKQTVTSVGLLRLLLVIFLDRIGMFFFLKFALVGGLIRS